MWQSVFQGLPLRGEGARRADEVAIRKNCAYIPKLKECFSAGSSGGNFLVPARKLIRSRLKGRCRKAAPLRIPRPLRRKRIKIYRVAMDGLFGSPQIDEGLCVIFFLNFTKERYCFLHGCGIIILFLNKMISSFYSAVSRQTAWAAVRNVLTSFLSGSGRWPQSCGLIKRF